MLIKINRNSIRKNPNVGNTKYYIPGHKQEYKTVVETKQYVKFGDKEWKLISHDTKETQRIEQPVQVLHSLSPEPEWLYSYEDSEIECNACGNKSKYSELQEKEIDGYWDNENPDQYYYPRTIERICPICDSEECCEIEFEKIEDVVNEANTN